MISLNGNAGDIITANLAIDFIRVRRINYAGMVLATETILLSTRDMSEDTLLGYIRNAIRKLIEQDKDQTVYCIGVGFQGIIENETGILVWSPIIKQQHIQMRSILETEFQLPVSVNNDCLLISEAINQSHKQQMGNSFATVLFSYGVGLGLFLEGVPFSGIQSSALEMGHLRFERNGALCRCGKQGCIEAYAADYGILRLASGDLIQDEPIGRIDAHQIRDLCDAASQNDEAAMKAFTIAGAAIGEGLNTLFTLFDPMPAAVVGRSRQGVDLMQAGITSVFSKQPGNTVNVDKILHCFEDAESLLDAGLTLNTLASADRQIAHVL